MNSNSAIVHGENTVAALSREEVVNIYKVISKLEAKISCGFDENISASVYAKLQQIKTSIDELKAGEDKRPKIEIAIEVGDNVRIEDTPVPHSFTEPVLHLVPTFLETSQGLVITASDVLDKRAGRDRDTLLHLLAFHGNSEALTKLFSAFFTTPIFSVDLPNAKGRTPLHYACGKGHVDAARQLLDQGAHKHARDAYGVTPFHFAARHGNITLLEMLQVENVDDAASGTQMTALHYAAWNGRVEAVEWLLSHGASVDVADRVEGNTPLHWAATRKESLQVINSLIVIGGASGLEENENGEWPIELADKGNHYASARAIVRAIRHSATMRMGVHKSIKTALLTKQQSTNGATMFHYFAAYGTQEDLEWLVALLNESLQNVDMAPTASAENEAMLTLNPRDKDGRTVVHWAARLANKGALRILAENKVDLHASISPSHPHKTPLSLAVLKGDMEFANELLKWKPPTENWLSDTGSWMEDYYSQKRRLDDEFERKFVNLRTGFRRYTKKMKVPAVDVKKKLFLEISPVYLALLAEENDIANFIQRYSPGVEDAVNVRRGHMGWTALHWATFLGQRKIVSTLCRAKEFATFLTANVEDVRGRTALQYAKEMKLGDIENELMQRSDVRAYVDGMYKDRQIYVDATNAILVGAALIASVTFVGWLQPPLSYTPYYNLPHLPSPSPPNIFQSYAAIQQSMGVRVFWIFNSLSFTMAIATMLAGLVGVAPIPGVFIASSVKHLRRCLLIASAFLGISIMFVLAAFAAAGFAVLPPLFKYQANMMATIIVGGVPCLVLLVWFAYRLLSYRWRWLKNIEAAVVAKLCQLCPAPGPLNEEFHLSTEAVEDQSTKDTDYQKIRKDYTVGRHYRDRPWDDGLDPPAIEMP